MKLNELPISIQKQINKTYENNDEILTKIKNKIGKNICNLILFSINLIDVTFVH